MIKKQGRAKRNGARPKKGRKGSGNRGKLLKAAMKQFLEKGYDAATTSAICKAARVAKPTLYYYVESKRDLFRQLHMEAIERDLKPHMEKVSAIRDPLWRLTRIIAEFAEIMCAHPELRVLIHETLAIRDDYFKEVRQIWKRHYELLRDTIGELQERDMIPYTDKPSRLALLALGMLAWIPFWYDHARADGAGEVAAGAVSLILHGLTGKDTLWAVGMRGISPRGEGVGEVSDRGQASRIDVRHERESRGEICLS
jgi:AcrR family transcriptional regulator